MNELIFKSATAIAKAIRDRAVSAEEVVEAHLRRIDEVNPKLNAVVQTVADRAIAEAREYDSALARGEVKGPLHGVPITIKDSLDTAGVVSTGGTTGRASFVPEEDATVVARLRSAGAILLGKTNTPEMTAGAETDNLVYGRTNNPYDLSRTPGGSSGGPAAIVAAGGSPLDLGSDTGGSIRGPAHCCGIAGIKPTSGRVPRTGHIIPFGLGATDAFTQIGPMARFVEDLTLALPIVAGPDWRDPAIVPMHLGDPHEVDLRSLRVAFHTDNGIMSPSPETAEAVKAAATALDNTVMSVEDTLPPPIKGLGDLMRDVQRADGRAAMRRLLQKAGTTQAHPWTLKGAEDAKPIPGDQFSALLEKLDRFRSEMLAFIRGYDAILCPTYPFPAVPHGEMTGEVARKGFTYTGVYNLTGWPGAVVRAGTSPEGMPIGVQIVARPWREDVALAMAQYLETALGGWQRPPL